MAPGMAAVQAQAAAPVRRRDQAAAATEAPVMATVPAVNSRSDQRFAAQDQPNHWRPDSPMARAVISREETRTVPAAAAPHAHSGAAARSVARVPVAAAVPSAVSSK